MTCAPLYHTQYGNKYIRNKTRNVRSITTLSLDDSILQNNVSSLRREYISHLLVNLNERRNFRGISDVASNKKMIR